MWHKLAAMVLALGLVMAAVAHARASSDDWQLRGGGSLGWTEGTQSGSATLDAVALARWHFLEVGGTAEFATILIGGTMFALSADAGGALEVGVLRLGAWAEPASKSCAPAASR